MNNNYFPYHMHTYYSVLDCVTSPEAYVKQAEEWGMKAICFSEHGNAFQSYTKYKLAHDHGLKFIYGIEIYLTESLTDKKRDNYHTILIARNADGQREINELISKSYDKSDGHFYAKPRISFEEFCNTSNNIISTSACIAGPLNKLDPNDPWYDKLARRYDYYEVQPHINSTDQKFLNQRLIELSEKYRKPLICGTDCHALTKQDSDCRKLLMARKHIIYTEEDEFDLTFHNYDDVYRMFQEQGILNDRQIQQAFDSTNEVEEICDDAYFDTSVKYPILHGSYEEDNKEFDRVLDVELNRKIDDGEIPADEADQYRQDVLQEKEVFAKLNAKGYMLFEYELDKWASENGINKGPGRGSVGGSRAAFALGITDIDAVKYNTIFSRFMNVNRVSEPDIDQDFYDTDRDKIYDHIIDTFGKDKTAFVLALGTIDWKGAIDDVVGGLDVLYKQQHPKEQSPYTLDYAKKIKDEYDTAKLSLDKAKKADDQEAIEKTKTSISKIENKYKEIFTYVKNMIGCPVSVSRHPAGIIVSPITLPDNYGTIIDKDGKTVLQLDMNDSHDCHLIKYDILGLNNIGIITDTCIDARIPFARPQNINLDDKDVWNDIYKSPYGIFQFESPMAYKALRDMKPKNMEELAVLNAALRPTGESYRDNIVARKAKNNPLPEIDMILKDSYGYIVYQEQIIQFLTDICGFSGSDADSIRRAIGKKDQKAIDDAMPKILEGYCNHSPKRREQAEIEAKEFMGVIADSAAYGFNKSHSIAYSIISYTCAYLRYHYPFEFITAYLNHAHDSDDISHGSELARTYGIVVSSPKFGLSKADYFYDKDKKVIVKGTGSIKYLNSDISDALYNLYHQTDFIGMKFWKILDNILSNIKINSRQLDILIKIGYFEEFGDVSTLLYIENMYNEISARKTFDKNGILEQYLGDANSVEKYANGISASTGKPLKKWTIVDREGFYDAAELKLRNDKNLKKVSIKQIISWQSDYMGYVNITTSKPEDIRKLIITKIIPLHSKVGGNIWSYRVDATSIGTGKSCTIYCRKRVFDQKPFTEHDIIYIPTHGLQKDSRGYWQLNSYGKILKL